jgi:hypothetical protein
VTGTLFVIPRVGNTKGSVSLAAAPRFVSLSFPFEVVYHHRRNRKTTMRSRLTFFVVTIATLLGSGRTARSLPRRTLTFAERVAYQYAIEEVYSRTNVWADGTLSSGGGAHSSGTIQADTQIGPHTVYAVPEESRGAIATHIGPNTTFGTQTCPLTTLPNDSSFSTLARAPTTHFRFERSVYLITAAELAAAGYLPGTSPTSIGWNYANAGVAGAAPLTIYLQNTTDTANIKSTTWAQAIVGMTVVHNATTNLPGTAGPFDIPFQGGAPFTYTGSGLYIAFDWNNYVGTLSSRVVACNTALVNGLLGDQNNTSPPLTVFASDFRPETRLSSPTQNDAAVDVLYSYGELPLGLVPSQAIKAMVSNRGVLAQANLPVALSVTGADTFSNNQTVATLAPCGGQVIVTFAPFTPSALGSDTVQVSVPPDDVGVNNVVTKSVSITQLSYSYKYPGSTASRGGIGNTDVTGAFVGKFTTTSPNAITHVKLEFSATSATTYRVAIYPDSGNGTPSTNPLYVDAADRTVSAPGPITITLPNPVPVGPGNFFVGIQQTNTTNASLSYDFENPIRGGSFYTASPNPPTAWTDFSPGYNFKLNIGLLLQTPGAPVILTQAVSRKIHGGAGTFDVNLPLTGTPGIECRSSGATHDYAMVVTFSGNVTVTGNPQAQVTSGTGCVGSSGTCTGNVTVSGNTVTVPLTNIANAQTINVRLNGVNSAADAPATDFTIPMSILIGDTNANRTVNAADVAQTKSRLGQTVDATNFRSDVNANGSINAADTAIVKQNSGTSLPP